MFPFKKDTLADRLGAAAVPWGQGGGVALRDGQSLPSGS